MKSHQILFIMGSILLSLFLIYVFICQHRFVVTDKKWLMLFEKYNIDPKDITHDESVWYFKDRNTCVFYSEYEETKCPSHSRYCSGNLEKAGNPNFQIKALRDAINNGGEHPLCPLIYPSTN